MKVAYDVADVTRAERVVTIGAFDGVHLGHRAVLRLVRELADARSLPAAVLTFDRHPAEVVRPDSAPQLLTTVDEKLELLAATGAVDECLVLTFDEARSKEPAEQFVEEVLVGSMRARLVVVGADFHFGFRRRGNVALLQQMGADLGFEVLGLGLVATPDGREAASDALPYSSTRVRQLLLDGEVGEAASVLGRVHSVAGTVEHGDERGRELGFPTANVAVPDRICVPGDGVYAGHLTDAAGATRMAAISIGRRPTFYDDGGLRLVEAHLLDFDEDLYGHAVRVSFDHRIRGQIRFSGPTAVDDLVERMHLDVHETRRLLET